jgi:hypothetical protein
MRKQREVRKEVEGRRKEEGKIGGSRYEKAKRSE